MLSKIDIIANEINGYCENKEYFWAYGLVKETLKLWRNNKNKLHQIALIMVEQLNKGEN